VVDEHQAGSGARYQVEYLPHDGFTDAVSRDDVSGVHVIQRFDDLRQSVESVSSLAMKMQREKRFFILRTLGSIPSKLVQAASLQS